MVIGNDRDGEKRVIYHIIQEGPGTGMVAACTSDPNGERNREPEERCNIPHAPHFTTLRKAHKYLRDTVGREPSPMELEGSTLVDDDERTRCSDARRPVHPDSTHRRRLGGRTLHTLAHSQWSRTRMLIAMCDAALSETIHMLVSDPNPLVRAYAIAHDHATREQVNEAMSDTNAQVVAKAARKCDDPQLLSIAATHEDREVRMVVASNPHTPHDALHALIRDADMWVRIRAARNPTLTSVARMILAEDEESWVRIANAEETGDPRILAIAARDSDADVALAAANNEHTGPSDLTLLSMHGDERVRRRASSHERTPEETALSLTYDKDATVRAIAGAHKNTPAWRKKELARDDSEPIVLNMLAHSTDTPRDVIHILVGRGNKQARIALLEMCRRH